MTENKEMTEHTHGCYAERAHDLIVTKVRLCERCLGIDIHVAGGNLETVTKNIKLDLLASR
jgi:hypothetical protein